MIRIKSKKDGFRRCGIAHPGVVTEYPAGRFSAVELKVLKAEPILVVEIVPDAPANAVEAVAESEADSGKEPVKIGKKGKR